MIPSTVPNRPMKGALDPRVARYTRLRSRRMRSRVLAPSIAPRSASPPLAPGRRTGASRSRARMSSRSWAGSRRCTLKNQSRSIITATLPTLRPMRSHNTQPEPYRVNARIRSEIPIACSFEFRTDYFRLARGQDLILAPRVRCRRGGIVKKDFDSLHFHPGGIFMGEAGPADFKAWKNAARRSHLCHCRRGSMRRMRLFQFAYSPFVAKVRKCLELKELEYEAVDVPYLDRRDLIALTGGYGYVPVLEDGGRVVTDSSRITAYLDERYPPSLRAGPLGPLTVIVEQWAEGPL